MAVWHARLHAPALEGRLQRHRVDDRAQHGHVVGGGPLDAELRRDVRAAEDVAAADDYRYLGAGVDGLDHAAGRPVQARRVYPVAVLPREALARELQDDALYGTEL
jgi:hypothetical protein